MKNKTITAMLLIFTVVLFTASAALADSFSGMVLDATVYGIVVQNDKNTKEVKLFQIRPETRGDKDPHVQDQVNVEYHKDVASGALVVERITITKRFHP